MHKVVCFDLDDTLYKEADYLKSAYQEIVVYATAHCNVCLDSVSILAAKAYKAMLMAYRQDGNAFERLNTFLGLNIPISDYLEIYRAHRPNIILSDGAETLLNYLKNEGCALGLITDGRSLSQRNKIEALRLGQWFEDENIIISEEFGTEKPDELNYRYFIDKHHDAEYFYIGDNPMKDFVAPNRLGWKTIRIIDDGRNIYHGDVSTLPEEYKAFYEVSDLRQVIKATG